MVWDVWHVWNIWDAWAAWLKRCRGSASKARSDYRGEEWHSRQLTLGLKEQRSESVRANARSNVSGVAWAPAPACAPQHCSLRICMASPADWCSSLTVIMALVLPFILPRQLCPLMCTLTMPHGNAEPSTATTFHACAGLQAGAPHVP